MEKITNKARIHEYLVLQDYQTPEDIVAFDIETTGFTAETTILYLIGCAYYQEGEWFITQWFNNDGISEREILLCTGHCTGSVARKILSEKLGKKFKEFHSGFTISLQKNKKQLPTGSYFYDCKNSSIRCYSVPPAREW